eukprot:TRINITY_DN8153_c0_g1_i1.p1 TRINITY_DN8153_c0_g1~~TRINITY_DN8153_c0_g1_i1.p1  ORF type:complete len:305 (+),score=33.87 TRINITY_DN8153_c0_g1_i1:69-917(+)
MRSMYRAAKRRTARCPEVDQPFSQIVLAEASEHVHGLSCSRCAASDSCGLGEKVRPMLGEESFDINGSTDTFLPGTCEETETSFASCDLRRGTDTFLPGTCEETETSFASCDLRRETSFSRTEEETAGAGAVAEEEAACAPSIPASDVHQSQLCETPLRRRRSLSTSAITLPTRFPGTRPPLRTARQTMSEIPQKLFSWESEASATDSDGASSDVGFPDGRAMPAIPNDALSSGAKSARMLDAARQKMRDIRNSQVSLQSKPMKSGRDGRRSFTCPVATTSR